MIDNFAEVMVRGYRDRPATLLYKGTYGDRVEVASTDRQTSIRVLATDVFVFDQKIAQQLTSATSRGNFELAAQLWSKAQRLSEAAND